MSTEEKRFKTMDEFKMEYFKFIYHKFNGERRPISKALDICERSVRKYIQDCKLEPPEPKRQSGRPRKDGMSSIGLADFNCMEFVTPEQRDRWYNLNSYNR